MIVLGLALAFMLLVLFPEQFGYSRPQLENTQTVSSEPVRTPASFAEAVSLTLGNVISIYTVKEIEPSTMNGVPNQLERGVIAGRHKLTSLGSGVIMHADGYILTNNHVVQNATKIRVSLPDGTQRPARAIGADPETDLAVLKVDSTSLPAPLKTNQQPLRVGDIVLAIGNPLGVGQTVTQGIISAVGRDQLGLNTFEDFIQTDAAINPGSSGGALVNSLGEIVGINTAIVSQNGVSQGIGFAIPIHLAEDVMEQIIEHGQVIRGWLGVEGSNVPTKWVEQYRIPGGIGVMITKVLPGGPADQAGFRAGDILLSINHEPIRNARAALNIIARSPPGTLLTISGLRRGNRISATTEVSLRPIKPSG